MARVEIVPSEKSVEQTKRLTVDIPARLHHRMKLACVANQQNMTDAVRALLERQWPPERAT